MSEIQAERSIDSKLSLRGEPKLEVYCEWSKVVDCHILPAPPNTHCNEIFFVAMVAISFPNHLRIRIMKMR